MNVGLLTTSFPRYPDDIAGHFVLGFARALVTLGHRVEVLAPEPGPVLPTPVWHEVSVRWTPYMRPRALSRTFYDAGVPDNLQRSVWAWLGIAPFIASLANETRNARGDWDLIISHWALPCALVAGALRQKRPHLAVFHSADLHLLRRLPGRSSLARRLGRSADKLIFVAPALRDLFLALLPVNERATVARRCSVFPMGIDPVPEPSAERAALRARANLDRFTLLFIGRLVEVKGVVDAIHAVARLRDLDFVIVGDGPERRPLERLAREKAAPVRFLGEVTGRAKHDLLEAADAFISPSKILPTGRTEGMPTALIEAMAHGLPIIATEVGGVSSVLENMRTALLVRPEDHEALRASVQLLAYDPTLRERLGTRGKELSYNFFWPALAPRLRSLLD